MRRRSKALRLRMRSNGRMASWPRSTGDGEGDCEGDPAHHFQEDFEMTFPSVAAASAYAGTPKRGPVTRLLEDERWLALVLLVPTLALLGLFIAYPFFKGVELSVTDTKVGVPGHFVGLRNFEKIWNDSIFHVAVWNTCLYTFVTTVLTLAFALSLP